MEKLGKLRPIIRIVLYLTLSLSFPSQISRGLQVNPKLQQDPLAEGKAPRLQDVEHQSPLGGEGDHLSHVFFLVRPPCPRGWAYPGQLQQPRVERVVRVGWVFLRGIDRWWRWRRRRDGLHVLGGKAVQAILVAEINRTR